MDRSPSAAARIRPGLYGGVGAALGLLASTGTMVEALPARAPTLCVAGETPLFACPIGRKLVAVCASDRQATYRFGRPGQIEFASTRVSIAHTGFSGGGERQYSVANGAYTYIVYGRTIRTGFSAHGHNNPKSFSGLLVQINTKTISSRFCDKDDTGSDSAIFAVPEGTFIDHD